MRRGWISRRLEGALERGKPPAPRPGVTITPPDVGAGRAGSSPRPGRYAVERDPQEATTRRLPAGLDTPTGPHLPSHLGLDHPVQSEPTLGDLRAVDMDARPSAPPPRRPRASGAPSGLRQTLGGVALVAVFGALGVTLAALWVARGDPEPTPEIVRVADPPKLPVDAPAPVAVAPAQAPAVREPPAPAPAPAPAPKEKPRPVAARPAPARPAPRPAPVPEAVAAVASLVVKGDAMVVELQGEFGGFRAGTPIPPGDYTVWADFGSGLTDTGTRVSAVAGGKIIATCNAAAQICSILH